MLVGRQQRAAHELTAGGNPNVVGGDGTTALAQGGKAVGVEAAHFTSNLDDLDGPRIIELLQQPLIRRPLSAERKASLQFRPSDNGQMNAFAFFTTAKAGFARQTNWE